MVERKSSSRTVGIVFADMLYRGRRWKAVMFNYFTPLFIDSPLLSLSFAFFSFLYWLVLELAELNVHSIPCSFLRFWDVVECQTKIIMKIDDLGDKKSVSVPALQDILLQRYSRSEASNRTGIHLQAESDTEYFWKSTVCFSFSGTCQAHDRYFATLRSCFLAICPWEWFRDVYSF